MPCKCSIYGCRSNYDSRGERVTIFSLPKNPKLRQKWIDKIPTDLTRLKHPFICIQHFKESDVIKSDILSYKGEIKEYPRDRPKLRDDAYPCIFPNPSDPTPSSQIPSVSTSQPFDIAENASLQETEEESPQNHEACVNGTNKCFKRTKLQQSETPMPPASPSSIQPLHGDEIPPSLEKNTKNTDPNATAKTSACWKRPKNTDFCFDETQKKINESLDALNDVFKQKRLDDECDVYAKLSAKKLRKYPERMRDRLMYKIDGLLLDNPYTDGRPSSACSYYPSQSPPYPYYQNASPAYIVPLSPPNVSMPEENETRQNQINITNPTPHGSAMQPQMLPPSSAEISTPESNAASQEVINSEALSPRKRCNASSYTRKRIKIEPEEESDLDLSTQSFPAKNQDKSDMEDQQQEDISNSVSTVLPAPPARNDTDEFEAAGVYIATKLRKMNSTQHIYAESLINQILTKGLLNKLTEDTKLF